jgi:beta-mannosidase
VGETSWTYRTQFKALSLPAHVRAVLAFEGLDTFAHVKLNGTTILRSDNMFLAHRIDVTSQLSETEENLLEIDFESALLKAREIKSQHPEHKFICFNGDSARLAVRKAQYHWGWDWGPFLMCAGIWRPIRLDLYSARISDIRTDVELDADYRSAKIKVTVSINDHQPRPLSTRIAVRLGDKTLSSTVATVSRSGQASTSITIDQPELWMPVGYGNQSLYHVDVSLLADEVQLHGDSRRIGIRSVELVQRPDSHGKSFFFKINGVDIFCGGSCWIPTDSFLTNVTREKYRAWIELMVPANQKMIRSSFPFCFIASLLIL